MSERPVTPEMIRKAKDFVTEWGPTFEVALGRFHTALETAETLDTIRVLQGRCKQLRELLRLPEALAAQAPQKDGE
jgi:hypothetical protein